MFSNSIKKALVVAGVALTLPVLSAGTAYADSGNGHGKGTEKHGTTTQSVSSEHGMGSETDKSGSSTNPDGTFQGKSSSTPDQDGKGMDRGAANNDKTGPGTDGNNGCGNEPRLAAPRDGGRPTDDDNNGWCGSKPKPVHTAPVSQTDSPSVTKHCVHPAAVKTHTAAPKAAPARVATPAPTRAVGEAQAPATRMITPVVTSVAPAVAAPAAPVVAHTAAKPVVVRPVAHVVSAAAVVGPVARTASAGGTVAASAAAPAALPFTGAPVGLLLMFSGLLLVAGALTGLAGTRRTA